MSEIEIISPPAGNFTPREAVMYHEALKARQEANEWVTLVYFLVSKYGEQGETVKLTIPEASKVVVPQIENQLDWKFDKETDTVTFEISEPKKIEVVNV